MKKEACKVINLDYLTELSKGNTLFVTEMIEIFIDESPKEIIVLKKAIHEKNFELIKSCAHKMKSTIPFVGLDKIIEKEVIEIEKLAAAQSDLQKIKKLFLKVKKAYQHAIKDLGVGTKHLPSGQLESSRFGLIIAEPL